MYRLSRKEEKTIIKISRSNIKQVDRYTYVGSIEEK
jgi:hypothetical protein